MQRLARRQPILRGRHTAADPLGELRRLSREPWDPGACQMREPRRPRRCAARWSPVRRPDRCAVGSRPWRAPRSYTPLRTAPQQRSRRPWRRRSVRARCGGACWASVSRSKPPDCGDRARPSPSRRIAALSRNREPRRGPALDRVGRFACDLRRRSSRRSTTSRAGFPRATARRRRRCPCVAVSQRKVMVSSSTMSCRRLPLPTPSAHR